MGVAGIRLSKIFEGRQSNTPKKFYLIVLWKTQNQQNKNLNNGNLVARQRSSASQELRQALTLKAVYGLPFTIMSGGDARISPKHLSFLIGGTGKITKGNLKHSDQRMEMSQTRQPSAKTVN
jgi:hypothetical protein